MGPQDRRIDEVMYLDRPAGSQERTYLWIRVLDESGHPIPGVAGGIDDFPIGTLRTMDCGCTWADSKPGRHILRIQKEGYDEKTVPLDVEGRFMNIEVVLRQRPGNHSRADRLWRARLSGVNGNIAVRKGQRGVRTCE